MNPDELRTYDRLLRWFLWTWLGRGSFERRPGVGLEEALRIARLAHRDHYPTRRPLREHEIALAWLATQLQTEEPRRVDAAWSSERGEVDVDVWADSGAGRRVAIGMATPERTREVLLDVNQGWSLVRQILGALGRARSPEDAGIRTDTVVVANPLPPRGVDTWSESLEDVLDTPPTSRRR